VFSDVRLFDSSLGGAGIHDNRHLIFSKTVWKRKRNHGSWQPVASQATHICMCACNYLGGFHLPPVIMFSSYYRANVIQCASLQGKGLEDFPSIFMLLSSLEGPGCICW